MTAAVPARPCGSAWSSLVVLYFLIGAFAMLLEGRAGQRSSQGWEFYAVTGTLFLTFAFPGFAYQYLLRKVSRAG